MVVRTIVRFAPAANADRVQVLVKGLLGLFAIGTANVGLLL